MRPGQDAAEQMQISPVGAEGSNVMPGQPARLEAAEVRRGAEHSNLLAHLRRDGTPHAGSTAGEEAVLLTAQLLPGKVHTLCKAEAELYLKHCQLSSTALPQRHGPDGPKQKRLE